METITPAVNDKVMSYKEWALTIFISSLPLIGIIMLLVWAFDSNTNIHKKNWAKGTLLIAVIAIIFAVLILFVFGGLAMLSSLNR
ncbi:MAG: hypothetical protein KDC56_03810 [Flavobacteriaceae bacterium]|nr:hypothetical protein [Flavobacteriaceae bacterium]